METFTYYYGGAKPIKVRGKNVCRLVVFAEKYRGWHTYKNDRATKNAIRVAIKHDVIEVNKFEQFRFKYPRS